MIVVTSCFSKNPVRPYDHPKRPPSGVDAYAFVDDPLWYEAGWRKPLARNNRLLHPRMRAKAPKAAPHLFFDDPDVLWLDSSMVWRGRDVASLFACVPPGGVGCFRHRFRECIYDEADASLAPGFDRYTREPIREQVAHYRSQGHPERHGLWEMGIIVWRGAQRVVGERWLAEMLAWTSQDQISWPVVCRAHGVTPTRLNGTATENDWFTYVDHIGEE